MYDVAIPAGNTDLYKGHITVSVLGLDKTF